MKNISMMALLAVAVTAASPVSAAQSGKDVFGKVCTVCHSTGLAGAPRFGNGSDWAPRVAGGTAKLYQSALNGTAKGMPAKGGDASLSDAEVKATVDYMLASVKDAIKSASPAKAEPAKSSEQKVAAESVATPSVAAEPAVALSFNRLLKPASKRNLPPPEDGIHDPANDGTHALQPPLAVFASLPKSNAGNRVDWVKSLNENKIQPRYDRNDPTAEPIVMDLNIVREVKGSMPDVVYPHKQHTQWLDCSNCHPAIFIPQKGANAISMAAILLGEKCGVCHGKVAFPVSECRNCHSKKKDLVAHPLPTSASK
jgi:c(7)-type cytochrome triheme protein